MSLATQVYDPSIILPLVKTIQIGLHENPKCMALIALTVRNKDTLDQFVDTAGTLCTGLVVAELTLLQPNISTLRKHSISSNPCTSSGEWLTKPLLTTLNRRR